VSQRVGLSVAFLSAAERSLAGISIANLQRLVAVYETSIASLVDDTTPIEAKLVHPRERKVLLTSGDGVRIENLVSGQTIMEPQLFTVAPGKSSGGTYRHDGEEFIFVLQGTVEVWLDKLERYVVTTGDCLYFKSTIAHEWKNIGQTNAILLWVNTPPTF
jgi:quercetin dioxygenase-like cupin family protein